MGYLREQRAIESRLQRNREAWDPHLAASRQAVHEVIQRCPRRRTALVLGAGLLNDLPLTELATQFEQVALADILHLPKSRRRAQAMGGSVTCLDFDCTGVVSALWQKGRKVDSGQAEQLFLHSSPELSACITKECDLIVSMNLASQLGNLPADWLMSGCLREEGFSLRLRRVAALRHVEWLRGMPGMRLLVTDRAVVVRERDGSESEREVIFGSDDIEPPQQTWIWRLAPIPEWDTDHHLELEVGMWVFGD
ncbi:MAG: hypothetical protein KKD63_01530 [Proteobacteria bacterium]|nr:hypothetical protein [Desulfobulbaceae bacterium]MBU4151543.1 hypothetical protein [Pseudomonadota bacterium]